MSFLSHAFWLQSFKWVLKISILLPSPTIGRACDYFYIFSSLNNFLIQKFELFHCFLQNHPTHYNVWPNKNSSHLKAGFNLTCFNPWFNQIKLAMSTDSTPTSTLRATWSRSSTQPELRRDLWSITRKNCLKLSTRQPLMETMHNWNNLIWILELKRDLISKQRDSMKKILKMSPVSQYFILKQQWLNIADITTSIHLYNNYNYK